MTPTFFVNEVDSSGKVVEHGTMAWFTKEDAIKNAQSKAKRNPMKRYAVMQPIAFVFVEMPEPRVLEAA